MKSKSIRLVAAILATVAIALAALPAIDFAAAAQVYSPADYTDNPYIQQKLERIFAEYPPGSSYFTNDGKGCTCHSAAYCSTGPYSCNCKRMYFDTELNREVDLLAWQCFGYARYVFYVCFGFLDVKANSNLYYNAGTIEPKDMTVDSVKELIKKAKTGAHIRTTQKHSMAFLSMDENGFTVVDGNSDGRCGVYVRYFTWEKFVSLYKSYGVEYMKIPLAYPGETTINLDGLVTGSYVVTATSLNIRSGAGTNYAVVGGLPQNTQVQVLEVKDGWGRIQQGWISLTYAKLLKPDVLGITAKWKSTPSYHVGDTIQPSDIEVTATYSNQITSPLTSGFIISCNTGLPGDTTVTISYEGQTASLPITILPASNSSDNSTESTVTAPASAPTEPPPPLGDVDTDGVVTITDARLALQFAVNKIELSHVSQVLADVDSDEKVTITDARLILQYAVGKIPELPWIPDTTQTTSTSSLSTDTIFSGTDTTTTQSLPDQDGTHITTTLYAEQP